MARGGFKNPPADTDSIKWVDLLIHYPCTVVMIKRYVTDFRYALQVRYLYWHIFFVPIFVCFDNSICLPVLMSIFGAVNKYIW